MPAHRLGEEFPAKSRIIITPSQSHPGRWRVDIGASLTGAKREQRYFSSKATARTYAQQRWQEIQQQGHVSSLLTAFQRLDAKRALTLLAGKGLTLEEAAKIAVEHAPFRASAVSVASLRERFLTKPGRRKGRQINRRARSLENVRVRSKRLCDFLGEQLVSTVTPAAIESWLAQFSGKSPLTFNSYRQVAHSMFAFAVREGCCRSNPVSEIPPYDVPAQQPSILSIEQARALLEAADRTERQLGLLAYVCLGLFAGVRRAELERLSWAAVKFDRGVVTIDATIAKNACIRNVAIPTNALMWLKRCGRNEGPINPPGLNKRFRHLRQVAGLTEWQGNELRHSFASYHFDAHQDAALTAAMLGHNSGTQLLFKHYRSLVPLGEGQKFFSQVPDLASVPEISIPLACNFAE